MEYGAKSGKQVTRYMVALITVEVVGLKQFST